MNFDGHALADLIFVDALPQCHDGTHILVSGREVLVERGTTMDFSGRTIVNDFQIGRADRNRINANQHLPLAGAGTSYSSSVISPGFPRTHAFIFSGTG